MIAGITTSADTTNTRSSAAGARIHALIAVASLIRAAIGVIDTLSTTAGNERIAQVSSATEADRSVVTAPILAGFTVGVRSARIRVAQIVRIEGSTAIEGMSGEALRTGADGFVVLDSTFGPDPAGVRARIDTLEVEASPVVVALFVLGTLGVAAAERIAEEVDRTGTDSSVIANVTFGVGTAGSARILATESRTSAVSATLRVGIALSPASFNRVTDPSFKTRADSPAVFDTALGIASARAGATIVGESTSSLTAVARQAAGVNAGFERIASETSRALASSHVVPHGALGVHSAKRRARIDAAGVVANLIALAIVVI